MALFFPFASPQDNLSLCLNTQPSWNLLIRNDLPNVWFSRSLLSCFSTSFLVAVSQHAVVPKSSNLNYLSSGWFSRFWFSLASLKIYLSLCFTTHLPPRSSIQTTFSAFDFQYLRFSLGSLQANSSLCFNTQLSKHIPVWKHTWNFTDCLPLSTYRRFQKKTPHRRLVFKILFALAFYKIIRRLVLT